MGSRKSCEKINRPGRYSILPLTKDMGICHAELLQSPRQPIVLAKTPHPGGLVATWPCQEVTQRQIGNHVLKRYAAWAEAPLRCLKLASV